MRIRLNKDIDPIQLLRETYSEPKYKLELKVVKNDNDWDVTQLSTTDLEKIHGIYNYEEE